MAVTSRLARAIFFEGSSYVGNTRRLNEILVKTRSKGLYFILILSVAGQSDQSAPKVACAQLSRHGVAIYIGQPHVHERDIRLEAPRGLEGAFAGMCDARLIPRQFEQFAQRCRCRCIVIHNEYFGGYSRCNSLPHGDRDFGRRAWKGGW